MEISKDRIRQIIKEELSQHLTEHDDDDNEARRVVRHIYRICDIAEEMRPLFGEDMEKSDVPEWIQEKIAVVAAMLQSILEYKKNEEIRE